MGNTKELSNQLAEGTEAWNTIPMDEIFGDISNYYAAHIVQDVLTIGKIVFKDGGYSFERADVEGPFNLVDPSGDDTRMVHLIGEIHPRSSLEQLLEVEVTSCLYLKEIDETGNIEVRSIHKGFGTSIYTNQECPIILWNPKYEDHRYLDVIDIQNVFTENRLKNNFVEILAESLREFELFPPLIQIRVNRNIDIEAPLYGPRNRRYA